MSCCSPREAAHGSEVSGDDAKYGAYHSDYGTDFTSEEEEILIGLVDKFVETQGSDPGGAATSGLILQSATAFESASAAIPDIEDHVYVSGLQISEDQGGGELSPTLQAILEVWETLSDYGIEDIAGCKGVEHPDSAHRPEKERLQDEQTSHQQAAEAITNEDSKPTPNTTKIDNRSPLERFRKAPMKGLSVTDLVSPAWCELQYWYTLTKHGRKIQTPAMKQGSAMHKKLEEEVHVTVPVEVLTREDGWALRIWNVIHGLQTLRTTGMTRELQVWGVIDGEIVTGIIDELSYECPDPELEAASDPGSIEVRSATSLTPEGKSLSNYLLSAAGGGKTLSEFASTKTSWTGGVVPAPSTTGKKIYITDIKTRRSSAKPPTVSSIAFRPTLIQLHLYYHMLTRLITSDDITIDAIASRHRLKTDQPFSDVFIAQVGSLNDGFLDINSSPQSNPDSDQTAPSSNEQDSVSILLKHNSLSSLWSLMKEHFHLTFLPKPQIPEIPNVPGEDNANDNKISPPTLLSPLLTAEYISSTSDPSKPMEYIGSRSFFFDANDLYPYLADGMRFWRGGRSAKGVGMVEAWKCRICEFRDECEWREAKEKEIIGKGKGKKQAKEKDEVEEINDQDQ
ncbi:uncharacterized protein CIMG_03390 [Coccidioides immitis RS]|uniref:Exonuclease V n=2 Tax=Coccidioides immitis TaxID=5501 RepID=A0A0J8QHJ6_COCIT|nr:uncharacterized protein CIMG_03390 [Coccidioides immitis RS]EAS32366.3 hypothetical protein CIMG_03390 [Coccidioides immitis RS]KMP07597.1 hypothetical protein CIRG_07278 [Coccidioides immitis RMSCC 2394]KMU71951.1 hypothetical protein CISG_00260 [Coccidioides immitis RMSCC 3703]TPX19508.1 hypothetical protein DIZ76_017300 [Coccidioides immitis]